MVVDRSNCFQVLAVISLKSDCHGPLCFSPTYSYVLSDLHITGRARDLNMLQQQAAVGYTWTLTPTSLLEARFGFDHVLAGKEPPYLGGPSMEIL